MTPAEELKSLLDKQEREGLAVGEMKRVDQLFWLVVPTLFRKLEAASELADAIDECLIENVKVDRALLEYKYGGED